MSLTNRGYAIEPCFWVRLLHDTFAGDLPEDLLPRGGSQWFQVVCHLLNRPSSPWWDDPTTAQTETRDQILARAFAETVAGWGPRRAPTRATGAGVTCAP